MFYNICLKDYMVKIKNKHRLKNKDIQKLFNEIHSNLNMNIESSFNSVEIGVIDDFELIFLDKVPCFFRKDKQLFYTIKGLMHFSPSCRFVTVDMGAVKFVTNGADIMAPGIVDADKSISVDDVVWICDETHKKALAVGLAVMNGSDMITNSKGKAVIMVHYIGDHLWNTISLI